MQVDHIGIRVKNMALSKAFYADVLGGELLEEVDLGDTQLAFFRCGTTTLELICKPVHSFVPNGVIQHIAFTVENLDAEMARLQDAGVQFLSTEPIPFREGQIIFFTGPDGERLELCQKEA
jgi:lactoylglutathione lyase